MTPEVSFHTIVNLWRVHPIVRHIVSPQQLHVTRALGIVNCRRLFPSNFLPISQNDDNVTMAHFPYILQS
jgi:hypothetical protein